VSEEKAQEEAKPCPFCGQDKHLAMAAGRSWGNIVFCEICEAIGPVRNTYDSAVAAWNTRPAEDALREHIDKLEDQLAATMMMYGPGAGEPLGMALLRPTCEEDKK
jgi:Lar family restriction alleviation protein